MLFTGEKSFIDFLQNAAKWSENTLFLVTGRKSFEFSSASTKICAYLNNKNIIYYNDFQSNFSLDDVARGSQAFLSSKAKIIIAVGGGSVIDMAKLISLGVPDMKTLTSLLTSQEKKPIRQAKLYSIPTTAGSGSEATHFAVVYHEGKKYSVANQTLLPDGVVLDPLLTATMSPYLTACCGFDALSQAIESYWARGSDETSKKFSVSAIEKIISHLENAVLQSDPISRREMMEGSHLAGKAINISKTTAPHALSYYLTKRYGIPHGHAVAIILGVFFEINVSVVDTHLYSLLGGKSPHDCKTIWYALMEKCGLETSLSSFGAHPEHIEDIVASVNLERLANHPISLELTDLYAIVKSII